MVPFEDLASLNAVLGRGWREKRNRRHKDLAKFTIAPVSDAEPVELKLYLVGTARFNLKVDVYFQKIRR